VADIRIVKAIKAGVITYNGLFSDEELDFLEKMADIVDEQAREKQLFDKQPLTSQPTYRSSKVYLSGLS